MIVYDGLKTDFLSSCERDSIAIEIEENILAIPEKRLERVKHEAGNN